jgi:hypothetical protein
MTAKLYSLLIRERCTLWKENEAQVLELNFSRKKMSFLADGEIYVAFCLS